MVRRVRQMDHELCLSLARKRFIYFLCEYLCDYLFDPAVDCVLFSFLVLFQGLQFLYARVEAIFFLLVYFI